MNFQKHPSSELVNLFNKRPYQGQSPEKANIIFLSSDANYSPEISNHPFFNYILEYQADGVSFWDKYGCHHPFLLNEYPFNRNKDGVPFHRNFSKIGLTSRHADKVCFLELLDVPTIGNKSENKSLFYDLVSLSHLKYIENLMLSGGNKLFFVSGGTLKAIMYLKKKHNVFSWLSDKRKGAQQLSRPVKDNKIQEIYHFSAYQIHSQVKDINSMINNWLQEVSPCN